MKAKKNDIAKFCAPHILFCLTYVLFYIYKKAILYAQSFLSQILYFYLIQLYHATVKNTFNYNYIMELCCDSCVYKYFLCRKKTFGSLYKKRRESREKIMFYFILFPLTISLLISI